MTFRKPHTVQKPAQETSRGTDIPRILRLFTPYRGPLLVITLFVVLSSLVSVASAFLLREILDTALPQGRVGLLSLLALGMIAVAVVTNVFTVLQTYLSTRVGQRIMHDLRTSVYAHMQRMSLAFFTRTRTGEVQSRIANDIGGMQSTVTSTANQLVSNLTTVTATLVAMIALDWRLTLVSLVMLPLFVLISKQVGGQRKKITTERQKHLARMSSTVEESLSVSGILLGRTMGRSTSLTEAFAAQSEKLADLEIRADTSGRWRISNIQLVMSTIPAILYWVAGFASAHGSPLVSIGTLVAFTSLQGNLFRPLMMLLSTGVDLQTSTALFRRIFEYLDLRPDVVEPADPVALPEVRGEVRLDHVGFAYTPDRKALDDVTVTVPAGGSLAVVGHTGSGKTTLGYLIPRLYDATSGTVTIDGVDVRDLSAETLAAAVGVVSQETYLFHASIADNLRFAKPDATDAELERAARAARIHDHIMSLPDGYATLVGERGYRFSGGEKQRLAIARTLLRDPPVLVLDEATSALDNTTERELQHALDALSRGRTTITIAHRLSTIRDADQIIVLGHGRVIDQGTHADLVTAGGPYAALAGRSPDLAPAP
ncbi:ATP-binding cassette subfamily B protein [Actinocorallia herbida]|uniref:ATP-binding cassette subfamily B protein n=1 Tax=Actinocorallia herbida TaxID=58109 RepID=A0A3N1CZJ9_9ACTN|nr:ABC transporter ATP-binding protein [Actinocorallia herbida]ROO86699.1 ATP-binding cassette subfamily B protein [Actinocorallia herbida]